MVALGGRRDRGVGHVFNVPRKRHVENVPHRKGQRGDNGSAGKRRRNDGESTTRAQRACNEGASSCVTVSDHERP